MDSYFFLAFPFFTPRDTEFLYFFGPLLVLIFRHDSLAVWRSTPLSLLPPRFPFRFVFLLPSLFFLAFFSRIHWLSNTFSLSCLSYFPDYDAIVFWIRTIGFWLPLLFLSSFLFNLGLSTFGPFPPSIPRQSSPIVGVSLS